MEMYENYTIDELVKRRKEQTRMLLQSNKKQIRSKQ